jgi:hypothetical protein
VPSRGSLVKVIEIKGECGRKWQKEITEMKDE